MLPPMINLSRMLFTYGDATLGICTGFHVVVAPRPCYRVTRRGNVYDDQARETVFSTRGIPGIAARREAAERWIAERSSLAAP